MLRLLVLCLALGFGPVSAKAGVEDAGDLPAYHAADARAEPVTEENVLESERFWPYHVALVEPWQPPGAAGALPAGVPGVLIRVEASGLARIDFGRDGLHGVPVAATDLVESANRIRRGELDKVAPNFVLDLGPRLADASAESLRFLGLRAAAERGVFLCVFADPAADGFAELAGALAPLRERPGLLTVLFAQGSHPDARLYERLRAFAWPIAFVLDHLAEPYTRSLLPEGSSLPALLLVSAEGRVLHVSPWRPEALPALVEALGRSAGGSARAEVR